MVPLESLSQPACITGRMKIYQLEGLSFLVAMHKQGVNSILADEMVCLYTMYGVVYPIDFYVPGMLYWFSPRDWVKLSKQLP